MERLKLSRARERDSMQSLGFKSDRELDIQLHNAIYISLIVI